MLAHELVEGARVLDVGCANGHMLRKLRAIKDIEAIGVDLAQGDGGDWARLLPFDGSTLPFDDKSVDYVLIGYVLHHLTRDHAKRLVGEAIRVTRNRIFVLEDSLPSFGVFYRMRNKCHRIESDLAYRAQSRDYRSPGNESMFLTHDQWKAFFSELSGVASVEVLSLSSVYRYAHHTMLKVDLVAPSSSSDAGHCASAVSRRM